MKQNILQVVEKDLPAGASIYKLIKPQPPRAYRDGEGEEEHVTDVLLTYIRCGLLVGDTRETYFIPEFLYKIMTAQEDIIYSLRCTIKGNDEAYNLSSMKMIELRGRNLFQRIFNS